MDANRKKDIAKDFADFLLKEKKQAIEEKASDSEVYDLPDLPDVNSLNPSPQLTVMKSDPNEKKPEDKKAVDKLRPVSGGAGPSGKPALSSVPKEASDKKISSVQVPLFEQVQSLVGQVESARAAQVRIQNLEAEREELRNEASRLLMTCEELHKSLKEAQEGFEKTEHALQGRLENSYQDHKEMIEKLKAREKEIQELKFKNNQLETQFKEELKKLRVREREYENMNLILKAESQAVGRAKDEMILDLKRKLDLYQSELETYKIVVSKNHNIIEEWRQRQSQALNSLRQGLNILDGDEAITDIKNILAKKVGNDQG